MKLTHEGVASDYTRSGTRIGKEGVANEGGNPIGNRSILQAPI